MRIDQARTHIDSIRSDAIGFADFLRGTLYFPTSRGTAPGGARTIDDIFNWFNAILSESQQM